MEGNHDDFEPNLKLAGNAGYDGHLRILQQAWKTSGYYRMKLKELVNSISDYFL